MASARGLVAMMADNCDCKVRGERRKPCERVAMIYRVWLI